MDQFEQSLYLEHMEEASFLFEQRLALTFDESIAWTDIEAFENRRKAHLDALEVGGAKALNWCKDEAMDAGDLYVITSLCCRLSSLEILGKVWQEMDPDDEMILAVAHALAQERLPENGLSTLQALAEEQPAYMPAIIPLVAGVLGQPAYSWLEDRAEDPNNHLTLCKAYATLAQPRANEWLQQVLESSHDDEVKSWAALAGLVCGNHAVLNHARAKHVEPWAPIPLGLQGSPTDAAVILDALSVTEPFLEEGYLALGLLGDPGQVPFLLESLHDPRRASYAASALNLILGSELYDEIFVPEEIDPDELDEEELAMWERGETPPNPDGSIPGQHLIVISRDPNRWSDWWGEHQEKFGPGRYRHGKVYRVETLVEGLEASTTPNRIRQYNALELAIHFQKPWRLDIFSLVQAQRVVLNGLKGGLPPVNPSY